MNSTGHMVLQYNRSLYCRLYFKGTALNRKLQECLPKIPISYLPSFLSFSIRYSKLSLKYWKREFCLCTSRPKIRLRNLVMVQSVANRGEEQSMRSSVFVYTCMCIEYKEWRPHLSQGWCQGEPPCRKCQHPSCLASCLPVKKMWKCANQYLQRVT